MDFNISEFNDFNILYGNYSNCISYFYDLSFPYTESNIKINQSMPWITVKIRQCIKKKSKLYKAYLRGKVAKADYTYYKNRLLEILRRSKRLHYHRIFRDKTNTSKIWQSLNNIVDKRSVKTLKDVKLGNLTLSGQSLANHANEYFINAASSITGNLSPFQPYVFLSNPVPQSCFFYPSTPIEVYNVIMGLKNHGNKLLDIHPSIIKGNSGILATQISDLYNTSITESVFPDALKNARVNPVHKAGPVNILDNFRPISVLPQFSKIFEKLTMNRMNSFFIY